MSYIEKEALLKELQEELQIDSSSLTKMENRCVAAGLRIAMRSVNRLPTADVEAVRRGEWVVDAYKGDEIVRIPYVVHEHAEPYCSLCGNYALLDGKEDYVPSNFCPNCGARMDGERREG